MRWVWETVGSVMTNSDSRQVEAAQEQCPARIEGYPHSFDVAGLCRFCSLAGKDTERPAEEGAAVEEACAGGEHTWITMTDGKTGCRWCMAERCSVPDCLLPKGHDMSRGHVARTTDVHRRLGIEPVSPSDGDREACDHRQSFTYYGFEAVCDDCGAELVLIPKAALRAEGEQALVDAREDAGHYKRQRKAFFERWRATQAALRDAEARAEHWHKLYFRRARGYLTARAELTRLRAQLQERDEALMGYVEAFNAQQAEFRSGGATARSSQAVDEAWRRIIELGRALTPPTSEPGRPI